MLRIGEITSKEEGCFKWNIDSFREEWGKTDAWFSPEFTYKDRKCSLTLGKITESTVAIQISSYGGSLPNYFRRFVEFQLRTECNVVSKLHSKTTFSLTFGTSVYVSFREFLSKGFHTPLYDRLTVLLTVRDLKISDLPAGIFRECSNKKSSSTQTTPIQRPLFHTGTHWTGSSSANSGGSSASAGSTAYGGNSLDQYGSNQFRYNYLQQPSASAYSTRELSMNPILSLNTVMNPANLSLNPANLRLNPANMSLNPANLRLNPANMSLNPANLSLNPANLNCSLNSVVLSMDPFQVMSPLSTQPNKQESQTPSSSKTSSSNEFNPNQPSEALKKMQEDFKSLLDSGENSDVTFVVGGKQFPAHRTVLCARSPVFKAMLCHDMMERDSGTMNIDDCDPDNFQDFLTYVYTGSTRHINTENVISLYTTSDKYLMDELKKACMSFMKANISVEGFCGFTFLALRHEEKELLESLTNFFCENAEQIIHSENWLTFLNDNPIDAYEHFMKPSIIRR